MKLYFIFILCVLFFLKGEGIYAYSSSPSYSVAYEIANDSEKTIKELQENIKNLTVEKFSFKSKWESFRQENGKINDFIESPLSENDVKDIELLISNYYAWVELIEKSIEEKAKVLENTNELKQELLNSKIELFKKLVPYIKKDKLTDYLSYIKGNIEIEKNEKNITDEIFRHQWIIDIKLSAIKEKIEENRKVLEAKIEESVTLKVDEKISKILENEKFKLLNAESQVRVFEMTFQKISEKKEILKKIESKTTIIDKKIEIYTIVENKLIEVIESIK